jgi:hypothetical protein
VVEQASDHFLILMDRQMICLRVAMRLTFFLKNFLFEGSIFLINVFLYFECGVYCPQPEDNTLTGCSTRYAKKQRLDNCNDDQSKITYIDGGTNIEYGSHDAMMTSPSFDGGWDNNMSSNGTMEALLAPEDASTSPSHDPHGQSTTNDIIQPSSDNECQLGATFLMPVGECIAHMAPNTATEDALLELCMTLS